MKTISKERKYYSNEDKDISGFSYQPDKIGSGDTGFVVTDSNPYILLVSERENGTFKECAYVIRENKYYSAPDFEIPAELFEAEYLPYLRWNFDDIELKQEVQEVIDEKGKKKSVATGRTIPVNNFPPSPENIAKMRAKLLQEATEKGELITQEEIFQKTLPTKLLCENFTEDGPSSRRPRRY